LTRARARALSLFLYLALFVAAVPDVAPPIFFNSGFMVLKPSLHTFQDLQVF
jgi:hypothetical protein